MKVLFINTNDISGGAARAAMRIMHGVQETGIETRMLVKDKYSQSSDVIPISHFAPPSNPVKDMFQWVIQKLKNRYHLLKWHPYKRTKQNVFMSDLRYTDIHGALQKLDYDVLHLHWINNRFLDIRELAKVHKPIVWTLHDSWPFCGLCHYFIDCERYQTHCGACPMLGSHSDQDLAYEIFEKKLAIYKDLDLHIVTPSRWLGECAKKSALLGRFPVHVIPNCLDTELFRPLTSQEILTIAEHQQNAVVSRVLREATEKRLAKPFILYGAMNAATDRRKGFASLLSAMQILDTHGFEARLVVFGAHPQDLPMKFENIDITFVGYIHDSSVLTALYNGADVMVVPSLTENLSCAIMESLSCGTPVVAFNIGGNGDMIDHLQSGYLAKEKDAADLANGIQWCIDHNKDNVLGKQARRKANNSYTTQIVSKQYQALYQSLC